MTEKPADFLTVPLANGGVEDVREPCDIADYKAWVRSVACCPACQVEPGIPCHLDGRPLMGGAVHPQRETEAKETAA